MAKKYYWLKLKKDFFQDKKMKKLRKVAGGEIYTLIYLKLQLLSLENEGVLFHDGIEEDFAEELSLDIDEEANHIEATLFLLEKWGLIETIESNKFVLPQAVESIGKESSGAERVRKHRLKKKEEVKVLQCNTDETKGNTEIEIEKEKELEIEKDKKIKLDIEEEIKKLEISEPLKEIFIKWYIYKKTVKKYNHKSVSYFENHYKQIGKKGGYASEEHLIDSIEKAMLQEYAGIFPTKGFNNKNNQTKTQNFERTVYTEDEDSIFLGR